MNRAFLLSSALALAVPTACRTVGGITGNEYAKPQAAIEWVARPELDQPRSDRPTVWIRPFKDAVGAGLDLTNEIVRGVASAGYEVVDTRDADYQLVATLRHFDKAKTFDGGESAMQAVAKAAPLAGAVGGAVVGGERGGMTGVVVGGIVGASVGTLAGSAMENFSKVYEWDLILDLELSERIEGGFTESRGREEAAASGSNVARGTESGSRTTQDERSASIEREQTHWRNTFRLVAVTYQMRMTREESLAALLPRIPSSVASVLP